VTTSPGPVRKGLRSPLAKLGIGALIILAALSFLAFQGLSSNLVYYITPSELLARGQSAYGESLRLGGQVRPGSIHYNKHSLLLHFVVQDSKDRVPVRSKGLVPPAMFRAGQGVVIQGTYNGHIFDATTYLIKHGSNYSPPSKKQSTKPHPFHQ
jgi:cytochrome c-type biogenesis protein CcmE